MRACGRNLRPGTAGCNQWGKSLLRSCEHFAAKRAQCNIPRKTFCTGETNAWRPVQTKGQAQRTPESFRIASTAPPVVTAPSFTVREAEEEDLEQVASVVSHAFGTFWDSTGQQPLFSRSDDEILAGLHDMHANPQTKVLVAVSSGESAGEHKLVGMVGVRLTDPVVGVQIVATAPSVSGKGVGRALMNGVIDMCEQEDENATLSLMEDSVNHAAFALYSSVGFNVVDVCTFFQGYVSDAMADEAIRKVESQGTIFRLMEEKDVPKCNELFMTAVGESRLNNIREAQSLHNPSPCVVAVRLTNTGEEKVLAYSTSFTLVGHGIAVDEDHFAGLVSFASKLGKPEETGEIQFQLVTRTNPNLVQWALKAGLRVRRQHLWMVRGKPLSVDPGFVYGIGLDY